MRGFNFRGTAANGRRDSLFSLIGLSLYQIMGRWATDLGTARANVDQGTLRLINEAIMSFRELAALGRRDLQAKSARVEANFQFLSLVPKYVLELGIVIGAAGLTYFLVSTRDPVTAFSILAFLATTSRIIPSLLRLQVAGLGIRSVLAAAQPTFRLQGETGTVVL